MTPQTYEDRHAPARVAEATFERFANHNGITIWPTGFEHHHPHEGVGETIVRLHRTEEAWRYWRFAPDYLALCGDDTWEWVEVKSGATIEREAFAHYMDLDRHQPVQVVCHLHPLGKVLRMARVSQITFQQSEWQPPTSTSGTDWKRIAWGQTPHTILQVPQPRRIVRTTPAEAAQWISARPAVGVN